MYAHSPLRDRAGSEEFISRSRSNSREFQRLTPSSRGHSFAEAKKDLSIIEVEEHDNETPAVSARGEQRQEDKDFLGISNRTMLENNNAVLERKVSINVARPHHVPKIESLSTKMEEIRRSMLSEELNEAPWDSTGKPKVKKKKKDRKKKDQGDHYQDYEKKIPGSSSSKNNQEEMLHTPVEDCNEPLDNRKKFTITKVDGKYIIDSPDAK